MCMAYSWVKIVYKQNVSERQSIEDEGKGNKENGKVCSEHL